MTKKEIKELDSKELIVQFIFASHNIVRGYKVHKCDITEYNKLGCEMIKRGLLTENDITRIYEKVTF